MLALHCLLKTQKVWPFLLLSMSMHNACNHLNMRCAFIGSWKVYRIASGVLFIFNLALYGMAIRIVEQCLKGKKKTKHKCESSVVQTIVEVASSDKNAHICSTMLLCRCYRELMSHLAVQFRTSLGCLDAF